MLVPAVSMRTKILEQRLTNQHAATSILLAWHDNVNKSVCEKKKSYVRTHVVNQERVGEGGTSLASQLDTTLVYTSDYCCSSKSPCGNRVPPELDEA